MKHVSKILGALGLFLIVVSGLNAAITHEFTLFFQIIGFVGLGLVFFFVYTHIDDVTELLFSRSVRYSSLAFLLTVLCLLVLILVNFIVARHPVRYDATKDKRFGLSPQTIQVLEGLDAPIQVTTFFDEESEAERKFKDLIDAYKLHTDKLVVTYVDPYRNPNAVKQFDVKTTDTVVFTLGDREKKVTDINEEAITNAIISLTRKATKTVCFLQGHGEKSVDDAERTGLASAKTALEKQSFQVQTVRLYETQEVPASCSVLVVPGPTQPLMDAEKPILDTWLKKGGRLIVLLDPGADPGWADYLEQWGFELKDDLVVDPVAHTFMGDYSSPICVAAASHKITEPLQQIPISFPVSRSVEKAESVPYHGWMLFLMRTGDSAWGETDLSSTLLKPGEDTRGPEFDEDSDLPGPVHLAALGTYPMTDEGERGTGDEDTKDQEASDQETTDEAMIAVFGDSDFVSNAYFRGTMNSELFLNTVSYMAREEDLVSIRPRESKGEPLSLTRAQAAFVGYMSLLVLPGIPLILGIAVYFRKRHL